MTASRGGGLDVSGSLSDADIGSLLLARELGERTDISSIQFVERRFVDSTWVKLGSATST